MVCLLATACSLARDCVLHVRAPGERCNAGGLVRSRAAMSFWPSLNKLLSTELGARQCSQARVRGCSRRTRGASRPRHVAPRVAATCHACPGCQHPRHRPSSWAGDSRARDIGDSPSAACRLADANGPAITSPAISATDTWIARGCCLHAACDTRSHTQRRAIPQTQRSLD